MTGTRRTAASPLESVQVTPPGLRLPDAAGPDEPWCHLRFHDGEHTVRGRTCFHIGHPLKGDSGALGPYCSWVWDGERLSVRNDRYGLQPLYYYTRHNEICIAPSIDTLLRHGAPTELDEPALAVFLRFGSFLDSDTPFRHISAVPPNASMSWSNGKLAVSGGFSTQQPVHLSEETALDAYIDLFRRSINRRIAKDKRIVLPLSGGQDSRHILLELCRCGRPPDLAITIDLQNSSDAEVAKHVARICGVPHTIVPETVLSLEAFHRLQRETSYNLSQEIGFLLMSDRLKDIGDVLYDGIGGDVLSAGLFLTKELHDAFVAGDWNKAAKGLLGTRGSDALSQMLQPQQYRRFGLDVAVERLSRELPRHQGAANPVGSFFFWNRTRRSVASVPMCLLMKESRLIFTPYLDDELFDFLSTIPASVFMDHQFHGKAIRRAFPDAGAIPFARKKEKDVVRREGNVRFVRQLAMAFSPRSRFISMAYMWPRLLRSLMDTGYRREVEWFGPAIVYLRGLESLECRSSLG